MTLNDEMIYIDEASRGLGKRTKAMKNWDEWIKMMDKNLLGKNSFEKPHRWEPPRQEEMYPKEIRRILERAEMERVVEITITKSGMQKICSLCEERTKSYEPTIRIKLTLKEETICLPCLGKLHEEAGAKEIKRIKEERITEKVVKAI